MNDLVVSVTTYKKNEALRVFISTYLQHGDLERLSHFVICDDDAPNAKEVFEEFKPAFQGKLRYIGGSRVGIAKNKNRGILFFRDHTESKHLILFDDDIMFVGSGLEKACIDSRWKHITGYLESEDHFFKLFPPFAEDENLWFCAGSQGMFLYLRRECVEKVGFMPTHLKSIYGFEHDWYSNMINRSFGMHPKYYALLKGCQNYFTTQQVPNNYQVKNVYENQKQYNKALEDMLHKGEGLKVPNPGVTIEVES